MGAQRVVRIRGGGAVVVVALAVVVLGGERGRRSRGELRTA
jgi:hypothetical protein